MAILVTGASGLVGRHLVTEIGDTVIAATRTGPPSSTTSGDVEWHSFDLSEPATIDALPWRDIDSVAHLAAYTEPRASVEVPNSCFEVNACGTSALLAAALDANVPKFLHTSSYWVYDAAVTGRIDESTALRVETPYGASKAAADFQSAAFRVQSEMAVTTLRPFNVYGPGARPHQVVPEFVEQAVEEGVIEPHPGNPIRDFLFVDDLVSAILRCLAAPTDDVFNVGYGEGTPIRDLASIVAAVVEEKTGTLVETVFTGKSEPTDPKIADTRKLQSAIDWEPETSLRSGIERLTTHYLEGGGSNDA